MSGTSNQRTTEGQCTILLSGGSGLIGSAVAPALAAAGHQVVLLCRTAAERGPRWDPASGQIQLENPEPFHAVIHLAGETIAQRWTAAAKTRIRKSRVAGTRLLSEALARLSQPPTVLICASATGYYGNRGDEWVDESSPPGNGFLAEVTRDWEAASEPARAAGIRVVHARFGIVLSRAGGALKKMLPAFRLGLGGPVGKGDQFWSWVTLDDVVQFLQTALTANWQGPLNVVAPQPVTSREFARALGRALHRPAILPVPRLAVEWLFGEMGREALLGGVRVRPRFLLEHGFTFQHPDLESAWRGIFCRPHGR